MKNCVSLYSNLPRVIDRSNYLVSSTDQIYQFDRSMTLGKLIDNNAKLLIFISKNKDALLRYIRKAYAHLGFL